MKIAVSATGPTLDAELDPRFGRCPYFIIADPETMEFETMGNATAMATSGAGISAAQAVADKGVQVVLTGNCGPNAYQVLSSAGIQVITGVSGKVKDAIEGYRSGKSKASAQANVPDHFGMGSGPGTGATGFGMGGGMGRGMGGGMGRGMGKGMGMGRGMGGGLGKGMSGDMGMGLGMPMPAGPVPQPQSLEQELNVLKAQSQALIKQLADIQQRIERLENKEK